MSTFSSDPAFGQLNITVSSTIAPTIFLSRTVPSGSVVDSYEVVWETKSSTTLAGRSTSYTVTGIEEDSGYAITVTATNAAESVASDPVQSSTPSVGTSLCIKLHDHS